MVRPGQGWEGNNRIVGVGDGGLSVAPFDEQSPGRRESWRGGT